MAQEETFHHTKNHFTKRSFILMTKKKRIIALALALVMLFAFMAMSASAATTEVQPRFTCSKCGGLGLRTRTVRHSINSEPFVTDVTCHAASFGHAHYYAPSTQYNNCATCGWSYSSVSYNAIFCYYGGYFN